MSSIIFLILIIGNIYAGEALNSDCAQVNLDDMLNGHDKLKIEAKTKKNLDQVLLKEGDTPPDPTQAATIPHKLMRRVRNFNDNIYSSTFMKDEEGLWPVLQSIELNLGQHAKKLNPEGFEKALKTLDNWTTRSSQVGSHVKGYKKQLLSLDNNITSLKKLLEITPPDKYPIDVKFLAKRKGKDLFRDIGETDHNIDKIQLETLLTKFKNVRGNILSKNGKKGKLPDLYRRQAMDQRRLSIIQKKLKSIIRTLEGRLEELKTSPNSELSELINDQLSKANEKFKAIEESFSDVNNLAPPQYVKSLATKELLRELSDLTKTAQNNYNDIKNSPLLELTKEIAVSADQITSGGGLGTLLGKSRFYSMARNYAGTSSTVAGLVVTSIGEEPLLPAAYSAFKELKVMDIFNHDAKSKPVRDSCIKEHMDSDESALQNCIENKLLPILTKDALENINEYASNDLVTKERDRVWELIAEAVDKAIRDRERLIETTGLKANQKDILMQKPERKE